MDDNSEHVILVDPEDRQIGTAPKLPAHREGLLHRALSVVIRDRLGRTLLQKRAASKYHSGGLWTNSCCSHPRPGESVAEAASRRLLEEMGFACPLRHLLTTTYRAELDKGLIEHEVVHIYGGIYEGAVRADPAEADGYAWVTLEELRRDLERYPDLYSFWFRKYVRQHWHEVMEHPDWVTLAAPASDGPRATGAAAGAR